MSINSRKKRQIVGSIRGRRPIVFPSSIDYAERAQLLHLYALSVSISGIDDQLKRRAIASLRGRRALPLPGGKNMSRERALLSHIYGQNFTGPPTPTGAWSSFIYMGSLPDGMNVSMPTISSGA